MLLKDMTLKGVLITSHLSYMDIFIIRTFQQMAVK